MVGIELVRNRESKEPFPPGEQVGTQVCMAIRKYGVILRPLGDTVVLMPPLSARREEIDHLIDALSKCIAQVTGE